MAVFNENKKDFELNIKDVFQNDSYGHDSKLQAIKKLKSILKPPDKVFSNIRLDALLQRARTALENKTPDKDFLFNYGTALIGFAGRESSSDHEILHQLVYVMRELSKLDGNSGEQLGSILWTQLEGRSIVNFTDALVASKQTIERIVLDWIEADDLAVEFPARLAAASQHLFRSLTGVLYEVLVRSNGHKRVLDVTGLFVSAVMSICERKGNDFLGLYPKDCCQLVALMMVTPEQFSLGKEETIDHVNSLLSDLFWRERSKAMILLSHYPEWVGPFKQYLNKTSEKSHENCIPFTG